MDRVIKIKVGGHRLGIINIKDISEERRWDVVEVSFICDWDMMIEETIMDENGKEDDEASVVYHLLPDDETLIKEWGRRFKYVLDMKKEHDKDVIKSCMDNIEQMDRVISLMGSGGYGSVIEK